LREIYRLNEGNIARGFDIVIVARARGMEAEYAVLERAFLGACKKLGLLAGGTSQGDER
jgi:ribonuclease P protein component